MREFLRSKSALRAQPPTLIVVLGGVTMAMLLLDLHGSLRWLGATLVASLLPIVWWAALSSRRALMRASAELVSANLQHLRELNALQGALAHELNNPLASIKMLAGLMALEPEKGPERLEKLLATVLRMQGLIQELLSFSRPLTPLVLQPSDLGLLASEVVDHLQVLATPKKLAVHVETERAIEMACDRDKVKQILMCLLHNAIDASPEGDWIAVRITRSSDGARLSVIDNGPGVEPGELARIVESGVTTKPDASGLGLTLARTLAQQHGGSLQVENRDGHGFAAHVQLPRSVEVAGSGQA
jgi:signal transduction histidine kinase